MARKSDLSDDVRFYIVDHLACFDEPSVVAAAVEKEFGIKISRQAVEAYDPSKVAGKDLSRALRERFTKARASFRTDLDGIPIASKAVRLRWIERMARYLESRGNVLGAAQLLEQAAKEVGGVYSGRAGAAGGGSGAAIGPTEPQDPGADRLAEIAARYAKGLTVVQGGKT